ncbi:hypothetical protein D3C86_1474850 [compost metagenome]
MRAYFSQRREGQHANGRDRARHPGETRVVIDDRTQQQAVAARIGHAVVAAQVNTGILSAGDQQQLQRRTVAPVQPVSRAEVHQQVAQAGVAKVAVCGVLTVLHPAHAAGVFVQRRTIRSGAQQRYLRHRALYALLQQCRIKAPADDQDLVGIDVGQVAQVHENFGQRVQRARIAGSSASRNTCTQSGHGGSLSLR